MGFMKKTWKKPKLIIYCKLEPAEAVLAACKLSRNPMGASRTKTGCFLPGGGCNQCNVLAAT